MNIPPLVAILQSFLSIDVLSLQTFLSCTCSCVSVLRTCVVHLQTIQDMLKQTKAGKTVSEADIPPPVVVPGASADVPRQAASDPHTPSSVSPQAPARQAQPAAASIEIPRPSVISGGGQAAAVAPIPRPRTNVQSAAVQEPDSSGRLPGSGVNVAKAAVNVPPVHLRTGPASEEAADRGNLTVFLLIGY